MAADAYSRVTGNLGVAISTSGPGATNMLTGVCCAYYDSIPCIYITGQVFSFRSKADSGVRQLGFQETDTVNIYRAITKYLVKINRSEQIRFELEKAIYLARSGRPGPVLIDIPDDIQRAEINPDQLESFSPTGKVSDMFFLKGNLDKCIRLVNGAKRPVIILGWGVRLAKAEMVVKKFIEKLNLPIALTWATMDMFPSDYPLLVGGFGTHGTRHGNFAVQNADFILAMGTRLDIHHRGSPPSSFAREAHKIIVDIDRAELEKFENLNIDTDVLIQSDVKEFLEVLNRRTNEIVVHNISKWKEQIRKWKMRFPICPSKYYNEIEVNPYVFVKILSDESMRGDTIVTDTGCALAWTMQAFQFKPNQRLFHDFNNTSMGYALPASIGASLALGGQRIICIVGDGSMQMNIQELVTAIRHSLPIKIFVINNGGYSMIRQTQDQWLDSKYFASSVEGGLAFPDFTKVAQAYGYKTLIIDTNNEIRNKIRDVFHFSGPVLCDVRIPSWHRTIPQAKFGKPIEDNEPLLNRKEFLKNMIIKPM